MTEWQTAARYTPGEWVQMQSRLIPTKTALIFDDTNISYEELNRRARRAMAALHHAGVCQGDRVATLLPNRPEFVELLLGCSLIGAVCVPLNLRLAPEEIAYMLEDSQPKVFIWDASQRDRAHAALAALIDKPAPSIAVEIGGAINEQADRYEDWLAERHAQITYQPREEDLLLLVYTSGTTGGPKAAAITHSNELWNVLNASSDLAAQNQVFLHTTPLFHVGGLTLLLWGLYYGATAVLHPTFHPVAALEAIEKHRVTYAFMAPAMWQAVMQLPDFDQYDLGSLERCLTGGGPCPRHIYDFFLKRHIAFSTTYGLTEAGGPALRVPPRDSWSKVGAAGIPMMHTAVRLVDENGCDVADGEMGELLLRGPHMMAGYWGRPDETAAAIQDGWFHTGDVARQDEDGFYYIVDRKKDMIIASASNIYPSEVEAVLLQHPDIADAAVIGVPHESLGQTPAVIAVPKPGKTLSLPDLQGFCQRMLAEYKIPTRLHVVDALPRNATGKVLKHELRNRFAGPT